MKEKLIDKLDWFFYDQLAGAIVEQAIVDWRKLIEQGTEVENWRKLIEQGESIENKRLTGKYCGASFNEIRRFFRSEHCEALMQGMKLKPIHILTMLELEKKEAGL